MTTRQRTGGLLLATTLLALLLAFPAFAGKGNKTPNPNNGHGKITAVSASSITVAAKKGTPKTFTISAATKVKVDGKDATVSALTVGEHAKIKSKDGVAASEIKAKVPGKGHKKKAL